MSQQNQTSFLLQAIGENYIMKTYAKGGRRNEKEAAKWQSTDKIQSVQYKFQSASLSEK
jgi:hypothetical protein